MKISANRTGSRQTYQHLLKSCKRWEWCRGISTQMILRMTRRWPQSVRSANTRSGSAFWKHASQSNLSSESIFLFIFP